jgi:hypothetical protein
MIQDYEVNRLEAIRRIVGGRVSGRNDGSVVSFLDGQKAPSDSDVDKRLKELEDEYASQKYARKRLVSYPELGEQLDMLFHDMTSGKGDKSGEWYKTIAKVKSDNPKE